MRLFQFINLAKAMVEQTLPLMLRRHSPFLLRRARRDAPLPALRIAALHEHKPVRAELRSCRKDRRLPPSAVPVERRPGP
jgi:hypothetical protein